MNDLLSVLLSTLKARITPIWTRLKYWTSWSFIKARVLTKIRQSLSDIFHVKPRDKNDYYPVFRFLVSKRLARAVVIVVGVLCLCYFLWVNPIINIAEGVSKAEKVYSYNSFFLRFTEGPVKIKAKSGYLAYEGDVSKGYVTGQGNLYNENGGLVYTGSFEKNEYSGQGTLYYPIGQVKYVGEFDKNEFNGTGTLYRENGTRQYKGSFAGGVFEGEGTLYNASEVEVFKGNFHNGELVYAQFLGKTPSDIAQMYTGSNLLYQNDSENAVVMDDIDAFYVFSAENSSVETEPQISSIYVGKSEFIYGEEKLDTIEDIRRVLGEPAFEGNSYVTFGESIGIHTLREKGVDVPVEMELEADQEFDEVWTVQSYPTDTLIYLYMFDAGGVTYTFFTTDRNGEFFMYEIEQ